MLFRSYNDVFGTYWERRNLDLSYILYSWQWDLFRAATYFYRPLYWEGGYWHFGIYARYPHRDYFYFGRPHFYASYRGGHSWRVHGRSFYEGRRDFFRPSRPRDQHSGMRNGWDRGDYRGNYRGSSTRVTVDHGRGNSVRNRTYRDNNSYRDDNSYRGSRSGNFQGQRSGNFGNSRNENFQGQRSSNSYGGSHSSGGSFSGSRSSNSGGSFSGTRSSGGGNHGGGSRR